MHTEEKGIKTARSSPLLPARRASPHISPPDLAELAPLLLGGAGDEDSMW
ncbi:MAG: hypothetical protein LBR49_04465 [Tannerella sp.]|nr:hypothetical protein [Tannerella sp.]